MLDENDEEPQEQPFHYEESSESNSSMIRSPMDRSRRQSINDNSVLISASSTESPSKQGVAVSPYYQAPKSNMTPKKSMISEKPRFSKLPSYGNNLHKKKMSVIGGVPRMSKLNEDAIKGLAAA